MKYFGLLASIFSEAHKLVKKDNIAKILVFKKLAVIWDESIAIDVVLFYQYFLLGFE